MSKEQKEVLEGCYALIEGLTMDLMAAKAALEAKMQTIENQQAAIDFLEDEIEHGKVYENNYIDSKATAKILGVAVRTIRFYNYEGKLTARKYAKTGRLYFPLKQVLGIRKEKFKDWRAFE
jgi:hypothetical protein